MPRTPPTTLLEDAIDVPQWLESDRLLPLTERTHRDRAIGKQLLNTDSVGRVRRWWQLVDREASDGLGRRLLHARQWLNLALAALGVAAGVSVAIAAFRYDGTFPVNIVGLLALLVAPQLVLLVLTVLLLPGRLPGLRHLQDALAAINPGALAAAIYRHVAKPASGTAAMLDWASARSSGARRFAKWQMLYWSQIAAVGFNVATIVTGTALIAFTDLAFGWSTTLNIDAQTATRIAAWIAAPWRALVPGAVPDAALVEGSQFFRLLGGGAFDSTAARVLTGWWPFTLLAVLTYGLIPRLAFWSLAAWRLKAATRALLLEDPNVVALLDRMRAPEISTHPAHAESRSGEPTPTASSPPRPALRGSANAVIWSQCTDEATALEIARERLGLDLRVVAEAGGSRLDADRAALADVANGASAVIVLTPAWEPPLHEFSDFLENLREAIGADASIVVVPIGEAGAPVTALERETWTRAVRRSAVPRVYVEASDA